MKLKYFFKKTPSGMEDRVLPPLARINAVTHCVTHRLENDASTDQPTEVDLERVA